MIEINNKNKTNAAKAVVAGTIGNVLEWYDFGVYGYMAPIISVLFFPSHDPLTGLIMTFIVFAVGFVMRPIGGILFGHFADKFGRKSALAATVLLMGAATFLIGILPTYGKIGIAAPVLLAILRIFQGISAAGEWTSSSAYLVEYANENNRGFYGSFQQCGAVMGMILGSVSGVLLTTYVSEAVLYTWGWRIPFILGILVALTGYYIRQGLDDTPIYLEAVKNQEKSKSPLVEVLTSHRREVFLAFGVTIAWAVANYIYTGFLPSYLIKVLHVNASLSYLSCTIGMAFYAICIPTMGYLSDKIGRKPLILASCAGLAILTYPMFLLLTTGAFINIIIVQLAYALVASAIAGPAPTTLNELLPTKVRSSGVGIGSNISIAGFGGTAPFIATALIKATGNNLSPTYYVIAASIVTFLIVLTMVKETHKEPLN